MGKKLYPSNVLKEAIGVQEAWKLIDEELAFGKMKIAGLMTDIEAIYQAHYDLAALETQLTEVRNRRDELYLSALSRHPTDDEMIKLLQMLGEGQQAGDQRTLVEDIFWSVLSSREFLFNH